MPPRKSTKKAAAAASVFSGQTFCISGKFSRSQAEMKELVTDNGGSIAATPSRACTYLVADALGSAKTEKAQKDGLDIVTEAWLEQSIKDGKLSTDAKLFLSGPNASAGAADMEDEAAPEAEEAKPAAAASKKKAAAPKKAAAAKAGSKRKAAAADDAEAETEKEDSPAAASATPAADEPASAAPAKKAKAAAAAPVPDAAPAVPSFAGKKFIVMGGFTAGKFKIESLISSLGGEITTSVLKSLSYCVCGTPVSTDYGGVSGPGSKKHKECKKIRGCTMLNEEAFFKLVDEIKAAPAATTAAGGAGGAAEPEDTGAYADLVDDFRAILKLLKVDNSDLKPATDAEITACESTLEMALPGPLRALLRIVNGSGAISTDVADVPHLFPSTEEIEELFGYNESDNTHRIERDSSESARIVVVFESHLVRSSLFVCLSSAHATVFRGLRWIPFYMIDYDFAWEGMDRTTGHIYICDLECNSFKQLGYTMAGQIKQYRQWLEKRAAKKPKEDKTPVAAAETTTTTTTTTAAPKAAEEEEDNSFSPAGISSSLPRAMMQKINRAYGDQ